MLPDPHPSMLEHEKPPLTSLVWPTEPIRLGNGMEVAVTEDRTVWGTTVGSAQGRS